MGKLAPYQAGDFVMQGEKKVGYRGPAFRVHYPVKCDLMVEMIGWTNNGYQTSKAAMWDAQIGGGFFVYGDIPQNLISSLQHMGVTVEKIKERGPEIPIFNGLISDSHVTTI